MTEQPPRPVAEGHLSKTPLAHVLVNIANRRLTGTLAVWPDPQPEGRPQAGQDRIRFQEGMATAVRPLQSVANMDRALGALFTRQEAPYAFYEADLVGSGEGILRGELDPYAVVARALRGLAPEHAMEAVLARLGDTPLRLRSDAPLDRLELEPEELELVARLRQPAAVPELLHRSPDPQLSRRVLYLLAITRSVDATAQAGAPSAAGTRPSPPSSGAFRPAASASSGAPGRRTPSNSGTRPTSQRPSRSGRSSLIPSEPAPPPAVPDGLAPEMASRWREIERRAREIDDQTYFEMLGVERSDGQGAIHDAYLEQVKRWHPDRLPPDLQPLKPWMERIFHLVTEARDTLSDADRRGEYVRAVQSGGGTPASDRKVNAIVGAAIQFQKVEVFARRKSWDDALEVLDEALELNPDEADFHAMRSWLLLQKHSTDANAPFNEMLEGAERALSLDERSARAHYTRGLILKRLGRTREAVRHFEKVTEIDPKHIEAAREVRLARMRARSSTAPSAPEGRPSLLSKLFGGKKK
ncbi:MAG: tetratricopeptide repeat protein [Myxococcota bacterium]